MKLNPLHLRIGLLVLNLIAAVGVPAYAFLSYKSVSDQEGFLDIADPADLVFREGEAAAMTGRGPSQLVAVASWVMPARQVAEAPPTETTTEASTVERPSDPTELEPGPLAEPPHDLEYIFSIVLRDKPTSNFVVLRKKDAEPGAAPVSRRTTVRRTTTPQRPARVTVGGRKPAGAPSQSLSFVVGQRRYTNEEQNLDFMIHSADEEKFVYWMPDDPRRMYALEKVSDSLYYTDREKGLRPAEKTPEELAAEEDDMKHFIFHDTRDVEKGTEKEYEAMLKGKKPGAFLSPKKGGSDKASAPASSPAPAARAAPRFGREAGEPPRTKMTDEEKQQLREAMRSPKMTPKDREELQKALMGAPGAK